MSHEPRESRLAALLDARREEIVARFVAHARAAGASESLPAETIIDSLREYLAELATVLRQEYAGRGGSAARSEFATRHGEQRFGLGYDVGALVREYGSLRELLWDVIIESVEAGADVPIDEMRLLFRHLLNGLGDASVKYAALRETELRRRTAEHIGFLAHELRNPLSSARMALAIMRDRGDIKPSRALDALERGLLRVKQSIDDSLVAVRLLDLGHVDRAEIQVGPFIADIATESATDADAKGVVLEAEGSGSLLADPRALRSAVSNLIRNAVKFTKPGGRVHVRARPAETRILIEVEDSCGGLPEGQIQKLFDPFVQVGTDRSGFGLGLAIAKQATEAHDGQLRVHDIPGKGCVFVLDLPAKPGSGEL